MLLAHPYFSGFYCPGKNPEHEVLFSLIEEWHHHKITMGLVLITWFNFWDQKLRENPPSCFLSLGVGRGSSSPQNLNSTQI